MFVGYLSVAQAAERLGVGVSRIHQRIADRSVDAQLIGSRWVVDELSVLRVAERSRPGRPLSARSAWAIIALAEQDDAALTALAPVERTRAKARLRELLNLASEVPRSEHEVRLVSQALRRIFQGRARMRSFKAAAADLHRLREDARWASVVDTAASGIASTSVDGYAYAGQVDGMSRDYLLIPSEEDQNVRARILPAGQRPYPTSRLLLAADLADSRSPREELRAAELVHAVACDAAREQR